MSDCVVDVPRLEGLDDSVTDVRAGPAVVDVDDDCPLLEAEVNLDASRGGLVTVLHRQMVPGDGSQAGPVRDDVRCIWIERTAGGAATHHRAFTAA
jgi:hypothetical protein